MRMAKSRRIINKPTEVYGSDNYIREGGDEKMVTSSEELAKKGLHATTSKKKKCFTGPLTAEEAMKEMLIRIIPEGDEFSWWFRDVAWWNRHERAFYIYVRRSIDLSWRRTLKVSLTKLIERGAVVQGCRPRSEQ